jgi:hypothetical protein
VTEPSTARYTHLGPFSGLVAAAKAVRPLFGQAPIAGPESRQRAKESFAFTIADEQPRDIRSGRSWTADGVRGEEISWSVGFGPRTEGFVLKPPESEGDCRASSPCIDHGHFKFFGKEKIADGPNGYPSPLGDLPGRQRQPAPACKRLTARCRFTPYEAATGRHDRRAGVRPRRFRWRCGCLPRCATRYAAERFAVDVVDDGDVGRADVDLGRRRCSGCRFHCGADRADGRRAIVTAPLNKSGD